MRAFLPALIVVFTACCSTPRPCIQPPPTSDERQNQIGISVAAQLASVPIGGSLGLNFSNTVNTQYDKLADNDQSLFLFLTAIECYLKEGQVGQDIAKQMAQTVQDQWVKRESAGTKDLRPNISKVDSRSPHLAGRIHSIMKKVGLE